VLPVLKINNNFAGGSPANAKVSIALSLAFKSKESNMNANQNRRVDIKNIVAILLLLVLCAMANITFAATDAKEGIVLQGNILKVLFNGKYKELKRGDFYGYGWLDDHRIFVAYQQEGWAEAIINADVIDLKKSRVKKLGTIRDAHGETNFSVNSRTGEVVFNAFSGGAADPESGILKHAIKLIIFDGNSGAYRIETIKENIDCIDVLWVDDFTIGATLLDEHKTFVTIPVPKQKLSTPIKGKVN
jgi:hypothetical protein